MSHPLRCQDVTTLYAAHDRRLFAYACALLGDAAAAEDVVHQVFLRLLRGDVMIAGTPIAYLCRAVRNAALNLRRDRGREVALDAAGSWLEAPPGLEDVGLALQQALRRLPGEQREVVVLHVWGHLTFAEIAEALDVSPNTAASRYRYALDRLRDILKPTGFRR